jgi:hypothetical protein
MPLPFAIVRCRGHGVSKSEKTGLGAALGGEAIAEGDAISLDGSTGEIFRGEIEVARNRPLELLAEIQRWTRKRIPPKTRPASIP